MKKLKRRVFICLNCEKEVVAWVDVVRIWCEKCKMKMVEKPKIAESGSGKF